MKLFSFAMALGSAGLIAATWFVYSPKATELVFKLTERWLA